MALYAKHCPKLPWMIDFHTGKEGVLNYQLKAAFAKSNIEHLTDLDVESQVARKKLTGIVCTAGPACDDFDVLEDMMRAGMTMIQVSLCHCSNDQCNHPVRRIRFATDCYSSKIGRVYPLGIAIDLTGPQIRTGILKNCYEANEIILKKDSPVTLTVNPEYDEHVTKDMIYVDYEKITDIVVPGDEIYIGDDGVKLRAEEIENDRIKCTVKNAGNVKSKSSVIVPGAPVDLPPLTNKDLQDIKYGMEHGVEAFFVSGVRNVSTVDKIKEILEEQEDCKSILVVAKLDNAQSLNVVDAIIARVDGIIVDRDGLAKEMAPEKVFLAQKCVAAKCNKAGKPVIISTHVLDSMTGGLAPRNNEISDVANAVLDGADCFILSDETALGKNPAQTVETLASICKEAEAAVYQRQVFRELAGDVQVPSEPIYALAVSVVEASLKCNAAVIVVLTTSGRSARVVARYRPRCPIVAVTRCLCVAKKLHLYRAIEPILYIDRPKECWEKDVDARLQMGITWGKLCGFVKGGDAIIIVNGSRPGAGFTNSMKILYASECDTVFYK